MYCYTVNETRGTVHKTPRWKLIVEMGVGAALVLAAAYSGTDMLARLRVDLNPWDFALLVGTIVVVAYGSRLIQNAWKQL